MLKKCLHYVIAGFALICIVCLSLLGLAAAVTYPRLPSLASIQDYKPKIPLRIYTADGIIIGEFGEEHRSFVNIEQVPLKLKQAILAAEDERFYEHSGVDIKGVIRATLGNISGIGSQSGASTITMQVAKNFFLSPEKTFTRKFNEMLLAIKIEHNLSKDKILELYVNQIYLGQKSYGFASAAQTYFGKDLKNLRLSEVAILAGLPKAPSSINPIASASKAKTRRAYVLRRMLEQKFITSDEYTAALNDPIQVKRHALESTVEADFVAEMVRQWMQEKYKEGATTQGFKVYTTLDSKLQHQAYLALRQGVLDYDVRHGYRGPEAFIDADKLSSDESIDEELQKFAPLGDLEPAVVLSASNKELSVRTYSGNKLTLKGADIRLVHGFLSTKTPAAQRIRPGAIIRLQSNESGARVAQAPEVESALVALAPQDGAIRALVGGFDFNHSNFNHVTQAWRQPGSSFKPFIYSAALEKGFSPSTMINDAPLVIDPSQLGGQQWEPKNFDGSFSGMMTMRSALTQSKNLVSIRILQSITPAYAQDYITRFGFDKSQHPAYLTMALGAGQVTPLQMAAGYAVFANGGYRVSPYFIQRIENMHGQVLAKTEPDIAGQSAVQVIDPRNAFVMTSMMHDVTTRGTAARAKALGRNDLAGKTGTTNDQHDAWFAGFQPQLVAVAWMGFDKPRSLGGSETGGHAALPIWMQFMAEALTNVPETVRPVPAHLVERPWGDRTEYYYEEFADTAPPPGLDNGPALEQPLDNVEVKDELF